MTDDVQLITAIIAINTRIVRNGCRDNPYHVEEFVHQRNTII